MADALYLDNDFEVEVTITRKAAATGAAEAATGLSGLTAHLAATPQGAAIHADVTINLSERGTTGIYYGTLQGDDLTTRLTTYLNTTVHLVVTNANKDVETVTPYVVRRDRII